MTDTRVIIMEAALRVFTMKGYTASTTKEIADESGFAEVTIFRYFQSKRLLFEQSIEYALRDFHNSIDNYNFNKNFHNFFKDLLHEKLMFASKNALILNMIIRETSLELIPEHLQVIYTIQKQVNQIFNNYFDYHNLNMNAEAYGELIIGIILRCILLDASLYYQLSKSNQIKILDKYANTLKIL